MSRANEAIISQALYGPELRGNDLLYQLFCVQLIELAGALRLFAGKISVRRSKYRKSSIKPPLGEGGGLVNLGTTMLSVLHKEQEYNAEKLKYKFYRRCCLGEGKGI